MNPFELLGIKLYPQLKPSRWSKWKMKKWRRTKRNHMFYKQNMLLRIPSRDLCRDAVLIPIHFEWIISTRNVSSCFVLIAYKKNTKLIMVCPIFKFLPPLCLQILMLNMNLNINCELLIANKCQFQWTACIEIKLSEKLNDRERERSIFFTNKRMKPNNMYKYI